MLGLNIGFEVVEMPKHEGQKLKRQLVDIESAFDEFVEEFGGEVILKHLPANPPENADYLFRNEMVIAELKCLQKDTIGSDDFQERLLDLYRQWERNGLITLAELLAIQRREKCLSEKCRHDLGELIKGPIEGVIKKANKQIKSSKQYFGLPEAKGLLLLASDGNYSIDPEGAAWVLQRILFDGFSAINEVVYFTVNMDVHFEGSEPYGPIWMHSYRMGKARISDVFQRRLMAGWVEFYGRKIGHFVPRTDLPNTEVAKKLRFQSHPRRP